MYKIIILNYTQNVQVFQFFRLNRHLKLDQFT